MIEDHPELGATSDGAPGQVRERPARLPARGFRSSPLAWLWRVLMVKRRRKAN